MKLGPGVNFFYITSQLGQQEANRVSDTVSNMALKRSLFSIIVNRATSMGLKKNKNIKTQLVPPLKVMQRSPQQNSPSCNSHDSFTFRLFPVCLGGEGRWLAVHNLHPQGSTVTGNEGGHRLKSELCFFCETPPICHLAWIWLVN